MIHQVNENIVILHHIPFIEHRIGGNVLTFPKLGIHLINRLPIVPVLRQGEAPLSRRGNPQSSTAYAVLSVKILILLPTLNIHLDIF